MKFTHRLIADSIFVAHFLLVLLVLFGWAVPELWSVYMAALVTTLISDLIFGYCILSKWEFDLRKRINPKIQYDFTWATYYTYKLTNQRINHRFFKSVAILFLILSIGISLYFKLV